MTLYLIRFYLNVIFSLTVAKSFACFFLVVIALNACFLKKSPDGVYVNIHNQNEFIALYPDLNYAHYIKNNNGYTKVDFDKYYILDAQRLSFLNWKSFNFGFEKQLAKGVSSDTKYTNKKLSFLWVIDNDVDDFVKVDSLELPEYTSLQKGWSR